MALPAIPYLFSVFCKKNKLKIAGKPGNHKEKVGGDEISMVRIITIKHKFATLIIDYKAVSSEKPASIY